MSNSLSLLLAMTFITVFITCIGLFLLRPQYRMQQRLKQHLKEVSGGKAVQQLLRKRYVDQLPPWLQKLELTSFFESIDLLTLQAGHGNRAIPLLIVCTVLFISSIVGTTMLGLHGLLVFSSAIIATGAPIVYLRNQRTKRIKALNDELPDCLDLMAKGLKSGLTLIDALKMVVEELSDPIASELNQTIQDIEYSKNLRHSFISMMQRVPSEALLIVVTAILLQQETGGNLIKILLNLRGQIRARIAFSRRLETLSAEGEMSAWILTITPFVLAFILNTVSPGYLEPLLEADAGMKIIIGAGVLMFIGIVWVVRLIRIQV